MATASSLFSPKSFLDRFRSPVFIASALSLGAHGVFFAAMPMLSASEDLQDKEESVPVVALSLEESQRLPEAVRSRNSSSNAFFGNDPFAAQQGESLLPVPGIPPYGDLTGLDSGFDDPLQTTPPLWGNPVDIFQDSLPAIPGQTSVIFPETNTFGSQPFDFPLTNSAPVDNGPVALNNSNAPVFQQDETQIVIPKEPEEIVAPKDQPLFGSDDVPDPVSDAPIVAPPEGTTLETALGEGKAPPEPVTPDALAQSLPSEGSEPMAPAEQEQNSQQTSSMAANDPALVAMQAEQQRLRDGYSNNGSGSADIGQVAADLGQLASDQSLVPQPAQPPLVVQYPDPAFKCPADSQSALFTLVTQTDGSILAPELIQSTQYLALDTAAQEAATTFAADLTKPGIYQLVVEFEDAAGLCATQDVAS